MVSFGERLKELRTNNNYSQRELAKKIGVDYSAISYWESCKSEPKASYIIKISLFFNVTTDYLLGLEDEFGNKYL